MSLKNILCLSVGVRILIVVIGMGLVFFRCVKSDNQAVDVVIVPLFEAAAAGQYDKMEKLLKNGESPNVIDNDGNCPLAFAVWNGTYLANQKCIELLLQHQADVRLRNRAGQPPLLQTIKIDYKDLRMKIIGKLIKFGANINEKDLKSYTLLEKTVENYDTIGVDMLLSWWGKLINPEVLKAAKERAIQYNFRDVLVELNKGIKPIITDEYWNPILIDPRTGLNDLHYSVINNNKNLVSACLERRADINKASEDEYGMRPLHYAVLHYYPDMVEFLLTNKANVQGTNLNGNTPLHMIAWLNDHLVAEKIADILLSHGALLNAKNKDGNTLLHLLIYDNNKNLIAYLGKKYEFDVYTKNGERESAIDLAKRLDRTNLLIGIKRK